MSSNSGDTNCMQNHNNNNHKSKREIVIILREEHYACVQVKMANMQKIIDSIRIEIRQLLVKMLVGPKEVFCKRQ